MKTEPNVVTMKGISIEFPGVKALDEVDFSFSSGEIRGLAGANGAGKSTLMKILSGVNTHYQGNIFLNGEEIKIASIQDAKATGLEIVYQEVDTALIPNLSVAENIMLNHVVNKMGAKKFVNWKEIRRGAKEALEKLNISLDLNKNISDLSLSQKQMVLIARAVNEECKFLILDEPTAPLSQKETAELFRTVNELVTLQNIGVVFISHRLPEILEFCTSLTVLRDGKLAGNLLIDSDVAIGDIVELMVGKSVELAKYNERPHTTGDLIIEVNNLNEKGERLKNISFNLHRGEIIGFTGLVGAGKTELCKTLFGDHKKTSGSMLIQDKEMSIRAPHMAVKEGMAFIAEERRKESVFLHEPIHLNLTSTNLERFTKFKSFMNRKKEKSFARDIMSNLNIVAPDENQKVAFLSGGNQQKVAVGKWFASDAEIYIFDEPTKGVDVASKEEIYGLIVDLVNQGKAVIYASCEFPEILSITDRVYVLYNGEIVKELNTLETTEKELLYYSTGGR